MSVLRGTSASRPARATPTTRATSSATASASSGRSTARVSRRCSCSSRRGRSRTRGSGRRRSRILRGTSASSRSTARQWRSDRPTGPRLHRAGSSPRTRSPSSRRRGRRRAVSSASATAAAGRSCSPPTHPDRVLGAVASRRRARSRPGTRRARHPFDESSTPTRAGRSQPPLLAARLRGFLEFFFAQQLPEPHSTKQIEDCVGWGGDDPETLVAADEALPAVRARRGAGRVRAGPCPVLVLHGDEERPARARGEAVAADARLARRARGRRTLPHVRDPVR